MVFMPVTKTAPNKETLERIIQEIPTPFHLYDESAIRARVRALQKAFAWNGGYREYFAVKANPNPRIVQILREEGCGVDCSSLTELMLAQALGFSGEEIMFSSNMTPANEFEYARSLNAIINLDDITHIDFLRRHGGIPERICLRYNPGGTLQFGTFVMGNPGEAKYGFTKEQLLIGVHKLMELGVKSFGLHAFLASNTTDNAYYPVLARMLFQLAVELHEKTGAPFFMINLSGGIGVPYRPDQSEADIMAIGEGVRLAHEQVLAHTPLKDVSIVTELGRYVTAPAGWLIARAIHEKHIYRDYIGLDACAADLMRPAMYGAYHHITVAGKENAPLNRVYDVVGSLCENNDKFAIQRSLPHIDMGDIVIIHDTGAHGHSMGYNYNGKMRPAEVLLKMNGEFEQIRRRETPRDYFATVMNPQLEAVIAQMESKGIRA